MASYDVTGTDEYGKPKRETWSDEPIIVIRVDACNSHCVGQRCGVLDQPAAMCPIHTRCRIVRVRSIAHEIEMARVLNADFDTTELRARQAARIQG